LADPKNLYLFYGTFWNINGLQRGVWGLVSVEGNGWGFRWSQGRKGKRGLGSRLGKDIVGSYPEVGELIADILTKAIVADFGGKG
jgi:hypothetical protein